MQRVNLTTTSQQLLMQDPSRVLAAFSRQTTSGGGVAWIDVQTQSSTAQGFGIRQQGDFILFEYSKWGAQVGGEWWGQVSLATDFLQVYEVTFRPMVEETVPDNAKLVEAMDRFDLACQIYA